MYLHVCVYMHVHVLTSPPRALPRPGRAAVEGLCLMPLLAVGGGARGGIRSWWRTVAEIPTLATPLQKKDTNEIPVLLRCVRLEQHLSQQCEPFSFLCSPSNPPCSPSNPPCPPLESQLAPPLPLVLPASQQFLSPYPQRHLRV